MATKPPTLWTVWQDTRAALAAAVARLGTGDAEAIHDARVATRRVETLLELLRPRGHKKVTRRALRAVADLRRALGEGRDLEVTLELLVEARPALAASQKAAARVLSARLRRRVATLRKRAAQDAVAPWAAVPPALDAFVTAVGPQAGSRVSKRLLDLAGEVVKATRVTARQKDLAAVHRLRVRFKRLRYALEALDQAGLLVLDDGGKRVLKAAQDAFGQTVDKHVAAPVLRETLPALAASLASTAQQHTQQLVDVASSWVRRQDVRQDSPT